MSRSSAKTPPTLRFGRSRPRECPRVGPSVLAQTGEKSSDLTNSLLGRGSLCYSSYSDPSQHSVGSWSRSSLQLALSSGSVHLQTRYSARQNLHCGSSSSYSRYRHWSDRVDRRRLGSFSVTCWIRSPDAEIDESF